VIRGAKKRGEGGGDIRGCKRRGEERRGGEKGKRRGVRVAVSRSRSFVLSLVKRIEFIKYTDKAVDGMFVSYN
jgi:hypothetical protein